MIRRHLRKIFRVLKKNGKALIIVDGKGGLISEIFNLILRHFFKNKNKLLFKKIFSNIYLKKFDKFLFNHYSTKERKIYESIKKTLIKT